MDIKTIAMIRRLLSTITWQKIVQVTILVLILVFAWTIYQSRLPVYNYLFDKSHTSSTTPVLKLSTKSQEEINDVVNTTDLIVGIHVTMVDFQKNTKTYVYYYIKDPRVLKIYQTYVNAASTETPLFNNDDTNNKRIIELINGEFICTPFDFKYILSVIPEVSQYVSTVCSNGIPPYYGKFMGLVSIYTKRPPTQTEIDQIRVIINKLSSSIYTRDIK